MKHNYGVYILLIMTICIISTYILYYPISLFESYEDKTTKWADTVKNNANFDLATKVVPIPETGNIPTGFYSLTVSDQRNNTSETATTNMMAPIAPGCKLVKEDDPTSGITPMFTNATLTCLNYITLTKENTATKTPGPTNKEPTYNPNDLNEVYHYNEGTPQDKEKKQQKFDPMEPGFDLNPSPLYYEPGSYAIDSTGYVPNYSDSLYLSTTSGMSQISTIKDAPYLYGGFCNENSNDKQTINSKCNKLDKDVCASTECCVLLGGQKCVAGNQQGPSIPNSYSDFTIVNRDFYYYSGKCFGNCPNGNFGPINVLTNTENTQNAMILKDEQQFEQSLNNQYNKVVDAGNTSRPAIPTMYPNSSTTPTDPGKTIRPAIPTMYPNSSTRTPLPNIFSNDMSSITVKLPEN
jgi:hypothetical protein